VAQYIAGNHSKEVVSVHLRLNVPLLSTGMTIVEISKALGEYSCEARDEQHGGEMYVARTKQGPYVLCRDCCKKLGLPLRS
jgi:hypothetical protein